MIVKSIFELQPPFPNPGFPTAPSLLHNNGGYDVLELAVLYLQIPGLYMRAIFTSVHARTMSKYWRLLSDMWLVNKYSCCTYLFLQGLVYRVT